MTVQWQSLGNDRDADGFSYSSNHVVMVTVLRTFIASATMNGNCRHTTAFNQLRQLHRLSRLSINHIITLMTMTLNNVLSEFQ